MASSQMKSIQGLITAPGLLARNPESVTESTNWEFPAPGLVRKRRGFERLTGNAGGPVWKLLTSRLLGKQVLAHVGTGTGGTQIRVGDGSGALTALTTVDAANIERPEDTRMAGAVCQRNHYVTGTYGAMRVESDIGSSVVRYAGMPRGLGLRWNSAVVTAANGWQVSGIGSNFAVGAARSYRVTWHRKDADGIEMGGAPTARWTCANVVGASNYGALAKDMIMSINVPKEFGTLNTALTTTASYFCRIWGTRQFLAATQLGNDEMYLLTERFVTAGEITAGFLSFSDSVPDAFLKGSPTLHTNVTDFPSGEVGLLQGVANEDAPPPLANDVAYWQDVMWHADITPRPTLTMGLIAQLVDGDIITVSINGVVPGTIVARNAPALVTEFRISAGFATLGENLRETVLSMVGCINTNYGSLGLDAFHISTSTNQPGNFTLEVRKPNATASVSFTSTVNAKFQPFGGYAFGTLATPTRQANTLAYSKQLRADAVPPVNLLTAGPADSRILRVFPFRDRMLVFTDYGIFQVTGRTFADFSVSPFDLGYRLMGREYVALCDEKVYAWCNEGIVEIDDGGVSVISAPIEPTIDNAFYLAGLTGTTTIQASRDRFAALGFATAYRNQHQVRFHFPETNKDTAHGCVYYLAFDTRTRAWTRGKLSERIIGGWLDNKSCGVVRFGDDLLCMGNWSSGADTYLFLERQKLDGLDDYSDTASDGTVLVVISTLQIQYQVPDDSGAQHWQQTVLNWDGGEYAWRPYPTSIRIAHLADGVSSFTTTVTTAASSTRIEVPQAQRRARRLAVVIFHDSQEYAGLIGIAQTRRAQGTRFGRTVLP